MKLIVCLETLPDPDSVVMASGEFNFEDCNIRLDSYSVQALEFALSLKDTYQIPVRACLLDSFELSSAYEEIKAVGADTVDWLKVPFTFDPFRRAELFAEAISPDDSDIIIAGYHCETCCTNSIPMLIALNSSLPYYSEINGVRITKSGVMLNEYTSGKETEIHGGSVVISVRTTRKLRYPSFRDRLACREEEHSPVDHPDSGGSRCTESSLRPAEEFVHAQSIEGTTTQKAASLITLMDNRGLFHI